MTQAELVGVWARESIRLGDDPPAENQVVRYLQARRCYADLRLDHTGGGAVCFAGTASWSPPVLRWHHDLDLDPWPGGDDQGEIEWVDGGRMRERGSFAGPDGPLAYEEVWARLPSGEGGLLALRSDDPPARLVQVGGHALVVMDTRGRGGTFAACYQVRSAEGWVPVLELGEGTTALPSPPARPTAALRPGDRLNLDGIAWTVQESASRAALTEPGVVPPRLPGAQSW